MVLRNALAVMVWYVGADAWARSGSFVLLGLPVLACHCIGLLTRSVAVLDCVFAIVAAVTIHEVTFEQCAEVSAVAASVSLLGPGAYSLDSRIRGGRRRIFPPEE